MGQILFHGSPYKIESLKRNQATAGEGVAVPEGELRNAIYLTPDYGFALAMAVSATIEGLADIDDEKRIIKFEDPKLFNPETDIFIYKINTDGIAEKLIERVDERQVALHVDEITPVAVETIKAKELLKYYQVFGLENEGKEGKQPEMVSEFKIKLR
jgi:hypothetical protein